MLWYIDWKRMNHIVFTHGFVSECLESYIAAMALMMSEKNLSFFPAFIAVLSLARNSSV